jgi:hypothetical protein
MCVHPTHTNDDEIRIKEGLVFKMAGENKYAWIAACKYTDGKLYSDNDALAALKACCASCKDESGCGWFDEPQAPLTTKAIVEPLVTSLPDEAKRRHLRL